jgi:hypothetical protein
MQRLGGQSHEGVGRMTKLCKRYHNFHRQFQPAVKKEISRRFPAQE